MGVAEQICPFDDLDNAPELALQLVNAAPAVCCRPPCARVNVKATDNIGDDITIENAVLRDAHSRLLKILDLAVLEPGDVFADLVERRIALIVVAPAGLLKLDQHYPL